MLEKLTFELFEEADAGAAADLFNRNRQFMSLQKRITGEDFLYVKNGRGMPFCVLAKKKDTVVGILAAYLTNQQEVAKPHQIYFGTFALDTRYRLSFPVLIGLFDRTTKEILSRGYREIMTGVAPENVQTLYVLAKYGFVLLDENPGRWGVLRLHSYFPAIMKCLGSENEMLQASDFFVNFPRVDKRRVREAKKLIENRYIECMFTQNNETISLLIDTKNANVVGVDYKNRFNFYPNFASAKNEYLLRYSEGPDKLNPGIKLIGDDGAEKELELLSLFQENRKESVIDIGAEKSVKLVFDDKEFILRPDFSLESANISSTISEFCHGNYFICLDHSTGFLTINSLPNKTPLFTVMWPCACMPYVEGAVIPREKKLRIDINENVISVSEDVVNEYIMTKIFSLHDEKIIVDTYLRYFSEHTEAKPLSALYVNGTADSCTFRYLSGQEVVMNPRAAPAYENYSFWTHDLEDAGSSSIKSIALDFGQQSTLDIFVDERSRPVIHFPIFSFYLEFEEASAENEACIEHIEIYFDLEDNGSGLFA